MPSENLKSVWVQKFTEHFDDECLARLYETYALTQQASVERAQRIACATEKAHESSLARVKDTSSVLELRDWICARVALSRRKKPLSASEIRSLMEYLRAAEPAERSSVALRLACVQASEIPSVYDAVDEDMLQWLDSAALHADMQPHLLRAFDALSLMSARLSHRELERVQSIVRSSDVLEVLRVVLLLRKAKLTDLDKRDESGELRGALVTRSGSLLHAPTRQVTPTLENPGRTGLCQIGELALLSADGCVSLANGTTLPPPLACKEYGQVIAADAAPLSSCIVAVLERESARSLVMWHAQDPSSYALAHTFAADARDDSVEVQLTADGDMLVQTARRGESGCADGPVNTFCFRMVGTDLSTLQHVDATECEELLHKRRFSGEVNHLNHGNLLTLERAVHWRGTAFSTFSCLRYAGITRPLPMTAVAAWGNAVEAFVWTPEGVEHCAWKGEALHRSMCTVKYAETQNSVAILRLALGE